MTLNELKQNIRQVREAIANATQTAPSPSRSVTLLAVSKQQPAEVIQAAFDAGLTHFGENYLQEALEKRALLADLPLIWHFIGKIQRNKTKPLATHFDWIQSVDSQVIAERLNKQRPQSLSPINICIQSNINRESQKSGVLPEDLLPLATFIAAQPALRLRGLMAIPAGANSAETRRQTFEALAEQFESLHQHFPEVDTLSMGMSQDFAEAIQTGSTMVRIGTQIFGKRKPKDDK